MSYIIGLLLIFYFNDTIAVMLRDRIVVTTVIKLTLPLIVPSLLYFYTINKDIRERIAKDKDETRKNIEIEKDKIEKSLPFFFYKDGHITVLNPLKAPILNVDVHILENDNLPCPNGERKENKLECYAIGGLLDGETLPIFSYSPRKYNWFVVSATTITNYAVFYVYFPSYKKGWHFYKAYNYTMATNSGSGLIKYIGEDYCSSLPEYLAAYISKKRNSQIESDCNLNNVSHSLLKNEVQLAFVNLITYIRNCNELSKQDIIFLLRRTKVMFVQLEDSKVNYNTANIVDYYRGNLHGPDDFVDKYCRLFGSNPGKTSMMNYLDDIIQLVENDAEISLEMLLRNIEVFVRDYSEVIHEGSIDESLKQLIIQMSGLGYE